MKDLTVRQIAAIKRQFKTSLPALKKIASIDKKIAELQEEKELQRTILDGGEAGIIAMTGGYRSVDLINCEYVPKFNEDGTPKMDKDGKYQLKEQVLTFVPPVEAIDDNANDAAPVVDEAPACGEDSCGIPSTEENPFPFND